MTPESIAIENLFTIVNKDGEEVDFKLNPAQREIDEAWSPRMVIPKARQEGVSSYFLAKQAIRCMGVPNTRAAVISHEAKATERMMTKVQLYLERMKGPKPIIKNKSVNELTFPKTNSMFYIGTAGSRAFGRGDTVTDLHCSEIAYWPDAKRLMTGLLNAVPRRSGRLSVESTGNGPGDYYHKLCMRSFAGESSFKLLFLPWWKFPEYRTKLDPEQAKELMANLRHDLEEPQEVERYNLTPEQVAWRREVLGDLEFDLVEFKKEYPSCLDDCFSATGSGLFPIINYVEVLDWKRDEDIRHFSYLKGHPNPGCRYVIGADVAAGVGLDSSVGEVIDADTMEQVGEYRSNRVEPDDFASILAKIGRKFNNAYIGVEQNNHGILTLKELRDIYDSSLLFKAGNPSGSSEPTSKIIHLGVRTSSRTKPIMIGLLRKALRAGMVIHSPVLKGELSTFIETDSGKLEAAQDEHDDTVMAMAVACYVRNRAVLTIEAPNVSQETESKGRVIEDPMSTDWMISNLTGSRESIFSRTYTESW